MSEMKDVLVLLPGIMGSALERNSKPVWDLSAGALGSFLKSVGRSVRDLAPPPGATDDGVRATHLMEDTHLIPHLWKIDGYSGLRDYLQERLELTPGENYFEFPYDWRLDNRIAAEQLRSAAMEWLEPRWSKYPDAKLVLIAHSMGGLVSRYFLEVLAGWKMTRTLVTLGTPHRGSMRSLDFLVNGWRKKVGPVTLLDLTKLVRSLPSIYQLLPIYKCVGRTEHELERLETISELGELDVGRAHEGVAFHREIEARVKENDDNSQYREEGYKLVPVVGTYQPTLLSGLITADGVKPLRTYKGETMLGGDGTVPRLSATPIESSGASKEMFAACPHGGLQNFRPIRTQIRAVLEDVDISEIKAVREKEAVSLSLRDAFHSSEKFTASIVAPAAIEPCRATVEDLVGGDEFECAVRMDREKPERQEIRYDALTPGSYRLTVEVDDDTPTVSDVFAVFETGDSD